MSDIGNPPHGADRTDGVDLSLHQPYALPLSLRTPLQGGRWRTTVAVFGASRPFTCVPGFAVLSEALTRHVDPQAGTLFESGPSV